MNESKILIQKSNVPEWKQPEEHIKELLAKYEKLLEFVKHIANEPMEINNLNDHEFDRSREAMALLVEIGDL